MQSVSDALEALRLDAAWFARAHELRVMTVHVAGDLRGAALSVLAGMEFHHDNASPWVVLEDAHLSGDDGWALRTNRLLASYEARRAAYAEREDLALPEATLELREEPDATRFARACLAVVQSIPEPMKGLVLVLAPAVLEDVDRFGHEIGVLLDTPRLTPLRIVWVLDEDSPAPQLTAGREEALAARCVADAQAKSDDVAALLAGGLAGGARSASAPPARVDDPPPLAPEQRDAALLAAGVDPAYPAQAPALGTAILSASVAMSEGRGADAVRFARDARDRAARLAMPELTVITQVTLATYLASLGAEAEAVTELEAAIGLAKERKLGLQEAQARLALGLLHGQAKRWDQAARQYAECARRAERAGGLSLLAIEGWRLAGQIAVSAGAHAEAAKCFQEAIRVAEWSEPEVVVTSSAAEAARQLAEACKARGLLPQADSLHETADAMEAGEVGTSFDDAPTIRRGGRAR